VYELTEYGAGLEEVVHAMARWGARSLGPPCADDVFDHEWGLDAFPALLYPERARGLTETYVIAVDDDVFTVALEDGRLRAELGAVEDPDLAAAMDFATFFELASGDLPPQDALDDGRVRIEGDPASLTRFFDIFSFASRVAEPAPPRDDERLAPRVRPPAAAAGPTLIRSA
jgi:alkyl sulfatase BDS1-like metallo-beta-lactamase superfamily hydrolase